jgi:hypothetical protein
MLSMLIDRMRALPDRLSLSPEQRQELRREISSTLKACSKAEL